MTKSEQLIEDIRQEIITAAETLTAPQDLTAWAGPRGILYVHVSAATGASLDGCRAKFQWHRSSTTEAQIAAMSIPLTPENFAGRAAVWKDTRPTSYIMRRMAEVINAIRLHPIDVAYRREFGREPDAAGFAFYAGLFDAGDFTVNDMLRDMAKNGDQS